MSGEGRGDSEVENFMFLIPTATLLSQFQRVHNVAQASKSGLRELPWEDWGPAGSRVLVTAFGEVAVSGTKVIAAPRIGWDPSGRHPRYRLFVLDTNPFAAYGLDCSSKPSEDPTEPDSEGGYITTCRSFQGPIRSELRCTATLLRDVTLNLEEGADARERCGWHDLVVFEDQWVLVSAVVSPSFLLSEGHGADDATRHIWSIIKTRVSLLRRVFTPSRFDCV